MPFPQSQTAGLVTGANIRPVSASATANNGDIVLVTAGSTAITITLPPVAQGGPVAVRKVDSGGTGAVTVKSSDGSTIDAIAGATGRVVGVASTLSGATLVSDGTNWWTVS
jgi:hypothetical protein